MQEIVRQIQDELDLLIRTKQKILNDSLERKYSVEDEIIVINAKIETLGRVLKMFKKRFLTVISVDQTSARIV